MSESAGRIEVSKLRSDLRRAIRRAGGPEEKMGLFDIVKVLRSIKEVKEVRSAWQNLRATTKQEVEADPEGEQITSEQGWPEEQA